MSSLTLNPLPGIRRRFDSILRALHNEAKRNACKGDLFVGWDWPTLRIVKPDTYAELMRLSDAYKAEAKALHAMGLHPCQTGCRHLFKAVSIEASV